MTQPMVDSPKVCGSATVRQGNARESLKKPSCKAHARGVQFRRTRGVARVAPVTIHFPTRSIARGVVY